MARKGEFTLLMEAASKWPWQVSAVLAPTSFLVCHVLAGSIAGVPSPIQPADMAAVVIHAGIHSFATILQFVFPVAFAIAALVSFIRSAHSIRLFNRVRSNPTIEVPKLSWQDFEALVAEGFRFQGFKVAERGGPAPDGGVDLVLSRGGGQFLVQCKYWRVRRVPVSVVRELYGVMAAERVHGGYVVTSGTFTQNPMVLRTATKGPHVGESFWGCAQFPKCQEIVRVATL